MSIEFTNAEPQNLNHLIRSIAPRHLQIFPKIRMTLRCLRWSWPKKVGIPFRLTFFVYPRRPNASDNLVISWSSWDLNSNGALMLCINAGRLRKLLKQTVSMKKMNGRTGLFDGCFQTLRDRNKGAPHPPHAHLKL